MPHDLEEFRLRSTRAFCLSRRIVSTMIGGTLLATATAGAQEPPTVADVSFAGEPLAPCHTVRTTATIFQVTIEDDQGPILNADDPASYLLLGSGPDGDFSTTACGPAIGDDLPIPFDGAPLASSDPTLVDVYRVGALDPGLYRFLVCDTVTDAAGNALDGDGDGDPGGDFVIPFFRADPSNQFENGHFDDCPVTLDPWLVEVTSPNIVQTAVPGIDDAEGSPLSASIHFSHSTGAPSILTRCVPVEVGTSYDIHSRMSFEPTDATQVLFRYAYKYFDSTDCSGSSSSLGLQTWFLQDLGGAWTSFTDVFWNTTQRLSVEFDVIVVADSDTEFDLYLDALSFDSGRFELFSDGFESGNTLVWSSSTQSP
ncbi:MAG: hypothetical protein GY719_26625 [bacterium]|nr:hypothetical protein [bacterium]